MAIQKSMDARWDYYLITSTILHGYANQDIASLIAINLDSELSLWRKSIACSAIAIKNHWSMLSRAVL